MAMFFVNLKNFSRSKGQSSVNAAAYRAAAAYTDQRTGVLHSYSKKGGVLDVSILAPAHAPAWTRDPEKLWNAAEQCERKNGRVARELLTALPHELSQEQAFVLAKAISQHLVDCYGVAAMCCVHAADPRGDQRNCHAHILFTTRQIDAAGFGAKTRVLDDRKTGPEQVEAMRSKVAEITNTHLERAGVAERVSHRTLLDQSVEAENRGDLAQAIRLTRIATEHEGQHGTAARRRGESTPQTLTNDAITVTNTELLRDALHTAERALHIFRRARGTQSRMRTRVHVETKSRATGKDAQLLNDQARLLAETGRVEAQVADTYRSMLEDFIRTHGANRAEMIVDYARLRALDPADTRALAQHAHDPKVGILLRQALAAERARVHASALPERRHRRYGTAMVRTQKAQAALHAPGAPHGRKQWAQLRRAQEQALTAARHHEQRAALLAGHDADYRANARAAAAADRLRELEHRRRRHFPLPGDGVAAVPGAAVSGIPAPEVVVAAAHQRSSRRPRFGRVM